jgi:hypothetical protein
MAAKFLEKGTGIAFQTFGLVLLGLVLFRQDGLDLHGSEFVIAVVAAIMLLLCGAAVSVYENKRERDVYEIRVRSYLRADEMRQERAQQRTDERQAADLAVLSRAARRTEPAAPGPVGEPATPTASRPVSARLIQLHEEGHLTDEVFEALAAELTES